MNRRQKLERLASEAEFLAEELLANGPIKFRRGTGVLHYLLSRCGHVDIGLVPEKVEPLPDTFRTAIRSLIMANDWQDDQRRFILITALKGLSRTIHHGLASATGMAHAVQSVAVAH